MARTLSSREVIRQAGITYRELDYWARVGAIPCSVPPSGPGSARRFTPADVDAIVVVAMLRRAGVELRAIQRAASLAEFLRELAAVVADAEEFVR